MNLGNPKSLANQGQILLATTFVTLDFLVHKIKEWDFQKRIFYLSYLSTDLLTLINLSSRIQEEFETHLKQRFKYLPK